MIGTTTDEILSRLVEQALGCGTYTGVRQHELLEEDLCEMCELSTTKHKFSSRCIECILGQPDQCHTDDHVTGCGTRAGYRRHYHKHEEPCNRCRLAKKTYNKHVYQGEKACESCRGGNPEACSLFRMPGCEVADFNSYNNHYRRGEKPCDRCRLAKRKRERHKRGNTDFCYACLTGNPEFCNVTFARRTKAQCGTQSGANGHRRRKETVCDPCKAASASYSRHARRGIPLCVPCLDGDPFNCEVKPHPNHGRRGAA